MADVDLHLQRADVQGVGYGDVAGNAVGLVVGNGLRLVAAVGVGVGVGIGAVAGGDADRPLVDGADVPVVVVRDHQPPGARGVGAVEVIDLVGGDDVVGGAAGAVVQVHRGAVLLKDHLQVADVGVLDVDLDLQAADGHLVGDHDLGEDAGGVVVGDRDEGLVLVYQLVGIGIGIGVAAVALGGVAVAPRAADAEARVAQAAADRLHDVLPGGLPVVLEAPDQLGHDGGGQRQVLVVIGGLDVGNHVDRVPVALAGQHRAHVVLVAQAAGHLEDLVEAGVVDLLEGVAGAQHAVAVVHDHLVAAHRRLPVAEAGVVGHRVEDVRAVHVDHRGQVVLGLGEALAHRGVLRLGEARLGQPGVEAVEGGPVVVVGHVAVVQLGEEHRHRQGLVFPQLFVLGVAFLVVGQQLGHRDRHGLDQLLGAVALAGVPQVPVDRLAQVDVRVVVGALVVGVAHDRKRLQGHLGLVHLALGDGVGVAVEHHRVDLGHAEVGQLAAVHALGLVAGQPLAVHQPLDAVGGGGVLGQNLQVEPAALAQVGHRELGQVGRRVEDPPGGSLHVGLDGHVHLAPAQVGVAGILFAAVGSFEERVGPEVLGSLDGATAAKGKNANQGH